MTFLVIFRFTERRQIWFYICCNIALSISMVVVHYPTDSKKYAQVQRFAVFCGAFDAVDFILPRHCDSYNCPQCLRSYSENNAGETHQINSLGTCAVSTSKIHTRWCICCKGFTWQRTEYMLHTSRVPYTTIFYNVEEYFPYVHSKFSLFCFVVAILFTCGIFNCILWGCFIGTVQPLKFENG